MRGYLDIVPVALRGSTGLYVRRESDDRVGSPVSGVRVQETGCATYRRYAIVSESDLAEAARRLDSATGTISGTIAPKLGSS